MQNSKIFQISWNFRWDVFFLSFVPGRKKNGVSWGPMVKTWRKKTKTMQFPQFHVLLKETKQQTITKDSNNNKSGDPKVKKNSGDYYWQVFPFFCVVSNIFSGEKNPWVLMLLSWFRVPGLPGVRWNCFHWVPGEIFPKIPTHNWRSLLRVSPCCWHSVVYFCLYAWCIIIVCNHIYIINESTQIRSPKILQVCFFLFEGRATAVFPL